MIKKPYFFFILITATISAQQDVSSAFVEKWDNSKNYLLDIAKAMPEEHYGFKPTDREMTFKEQLFHIIENMDWLSLTYFTTDKHQKKDRTKIVTKQQVLEEIRLAFDTAKNRIQSNPNVDLSQKADFFAGPKSKLQIMNLMQDHVNSPPRSNYSLLKHESNITSQICRLVKSKKNEKNSTNYFGNYGFFL